MRDQQFSTTPPDTNASVESSSTGKASTDLSRQLDYLRKRFDTSSQHSEPTKDFHSDLTFTVPPRSTKASQLVSTQPERSNNSTLPGSARSGPRSTLEPLYGDDSRQEDGQSSLPPASAARESRGAESSKDLIPHLSGVWGPPGGSAATATVTPSSAEAPLVSETSKMSAKEFAPSLASIGTGQGTGLRSSSDTPEQNRDTFLSAKDTHSAGARYNVAGTDDKVTGSGNSRRFQASAADPFAKKAKVDPEDSSSVATLTGKKSSALGKRSRRPHEIDDVSFEVLEIPTHSVQSVTSLPASKKARGWSISVPDANADISYAPPGDQVGEPGVRLSDEKYNDNKENNTTVGKEVPVRNFGRKRGRDGLRSTNVR